MNKLKYGVALIALMMGATTALADGKLNVVCSTEQAWCDLITSEFEKETGVKVSMVRKSTGETLAQIRAEAKNPKIDIWWGGTGDPHLVAANEGLTQPSGYDTKELLSWAVNMSTISDGKTVGIYAGALGIGYNPELLAEKNLPAPKCWKDLADPVYKGEVQVASPNSSGTAYTELATFVQLFGEDKAFELLGQIGKNVNQYTKSGSAPGKAAARGETTIAITFMHGLVKLATQGFPMVIVSPCEGTGYEVGAVSIIKGSRNLENAKKWVEFGLRPKTQALAATVGSFQVPSNSGSTVPKESPDLSSIKLIDYDFATYGSSETRKSLVGRWNEEIKDIPR